jgi:LuxR family maltose regulon positive regulatory protein
MEFLQTKFDPPVEPGDWVVRPRLLDRLQAIRTVTLTLVQTPAGYGKTSLLSQWHHGLRQAGESVCWLSLDSNDNDAAGLLSYVAATVARTGIAFDPPISRIAGGDFFAKHELLVSNVVNTLERSRRTVFIFLDDVHLLGAPALAALSRLIEFSPSTVHYIFASRTVPAMNLARLRAAGRLFELSVEDLRFAPEETHAFFHRLGQCSLSDAEVALLETRTEGWIAGIKLIELAIRQGCSAHLLLASFTGSFRSVSDFFAEEVLSFQSPEVREFLLKTSVLERLCPALCDAVTGGDVGRQTLSRIESTGLFLLRLDDERYWYRYHHLFAEFLRRRLLEEHGELAQELRMRASRWSWSNGFQIEAIQYALDGQNPEHAATLLELCCQEMTYIGQLNIVSKFAERIPPETLNRFPRVVLSITWMLTRQLRFEEAHRLVDIARQLIAELGASSQAAPEELKNLRQILLHREMVLASAHDDVPRVEEYCRQLVEQMDDQEVHPYIASTIFAQLLYARREQYILDDLDRLTAKAQGLVARSSLGFASIALQASIGPSLFFAGRSDAATRSLEQGLAEAVRFSGLKSAMAALPAPPLSEILYEENNLERAEELIEATLPYLTEYGFVDQLMPGYITRARIQNARGNHLEALDGLEEGLTVAVERGLERLRLAVIAERIRLQIQHGQLDEAVQGLKSMGVPDAIEDLMPARSVTTRDELKAISWYRIALAQTRTQDAIAVAKQWRRFCLGRGAVRSLVRWDILAAQALYLQGDQRAAQRTLREAVAKASSSRFVRSFIDEGAVICTLLNSIYEGDLEVLHPSDAFAAELLEIFERNGPKTGKRVTQPAPQGLLGKLSSKECEVLGLVSLGMRNREVAQKLGMTEGSVKWYMQQVYDKIGTRRRFRAVERARQYGLIA